MYLLRYLKEHSQCGNESGDRGDAGDEFPDRFFGNMLLWEKNTLRNGDMHISQDKTDGAQNKAQKETTDTETTVRDFLKERPDATQTEIAAATGTSSSLPRYSIITCSIFIVLCS